MTTFELEKKGLESIMKNPALFFGAILVAIIGFFCLAVVGVIAALVTRPKAEVRYK